MHNGDAMGFGLITTYFMFPLTTAIFSAYISRNNPMLLIPFVLIMFAAQNFMPFIVYGSFEVSLIACFTFIPASIGAIIGMILRNSKTDCSQ